MKTVEFPEKRDSRDGDMTEFPENRDSVVKGLRNGSLLGKTPHKV